MYGFGVGLRRELTDVRRDNLFDKNVTAFASIHGHETRQERRDLYPHEELVAYTFHHTGDATVQLRAHKQSEIQPSAGNVREGVCRVDGLRGEGRIDMLFEITVHPFTFFVRKLVISDKHDSVFGEFGDDLVAENARMSLDQFRNADLDLLQELGERVAVRRDVEAVAELFLKTRDPDHEELVNIRCENRHELQPLEDRL